MSRSNAIPNPRGAVDVWGWDWSWDTWSSITNAPEAIPGPGTTCIYVEPAASGCGLENTEGGIPLPPDTVAGDWISCQLEVLAGGTVDDAEAVLSLTVSWYDDEGNGVDDPTSVWLEGDPDTTLSYKNLVNETFWLSAAPRTLDDVDFLLPVEGFMRIARNLLVPAGATRFDYCLTVNDFVEGGSDLIALYFTNMQVEKAADGELTVIGDYADGDTAGWEWTGTEHRSVSIESPAIDAVAIDAGAARRNLTNCPEFKGTAWATPDRPTYPWVVVPDSSPAPLEDADGLFFGDDFLEPVTSVPGVDLPAGCAYAVRVPYLGAQESGDCDIWNDGKAVGGPYNEGNPWPARGSRLQGPFRQTLEAGKDYIASIYVYAPDCAGKDDASHSYSLDISVEGDLNRDKDLAYEETPEIGSVYAPDYSVSWCEVRSTEDGWMRLITSFHIESEMTNWTFLWLAWARGVLKNNYAYFTGFLVEEKPEGAELVDATTLYDAIEYQISYTSLPLQIDHTNEDGTVIWNYAKGYVEEENKVWLPRDFADGDSGGWSWDGVEHASQSRNGGEPRILINGGAAYVFDLHVMLTIEAPAEAKYMALRNDEDEWGAWELYASSKAWMLDEGSAGPRKVWCRFGTDPPEEEPGD